VLGVPQDAVTTMVEAAYIQLAKQWHPDRVPMELADLRPAVSKIFARMNEAHRTLMDPTRRAEYMQVLAHGGGSAREQEIVDRAVDSAMLFQRAEFALKRNALAEAEELLYQAVAADPDPPEYRSLLAWVRAQRRPAPPTPRDARITYADDIEMLDLVLREYHDFERALFYRAELLKRIGETERSMRDYRAAFAQNPRNIDAAREIRLYEKRKREGEATPGFLGRLFTRDSEQGGPRSKAPPPKGKPKDRGRRG
jgi:curved DNA-binding protein CbpA